MASNKQKSGSPDPFSLICCGCLVLVIILLIALPAGLLGMISGEKQTFSDTGGGSGSGTNLNENCCVEYIKKHKNVSLTDDEMKQYCQWFQSYSSASGIDPALSMAIATQESRFDKDAVSSSDAQGLMQLKIPVAKDVGLAAGDRKDPEKNIKGGTAYLKKLNEYLNANLKGDKNNIIASYNAGAETVNDANGDISKLPNETQNYVPAVNGFYSGPDGIAKCLESTVASGDCGTQAEKAVFFANKQVGKTYSQAQPSFGDINYNHFDCAGLYSSAWYYAGVFKKMHSIVPSFYKPYDELNYFQVSSRQEMLAQMQPGDAVFAGAFENADDKTPDYSGRPSPVHDYGHMGMYIGDGKVTEAKGINYGILTTVFNNGSWALEYGRPKKCSGGVTAESVSCDGLSITKQPRSNLETYKKQIQEYNKLHYGDGEDTWQLTPKIIVLHYTVSPPGKIPPILLSGNETPDTVSGYTNGHPGVSVHYVVDQGKIYETLPTNIRSRGAFGVNNVSLNIEMVAMDENSLLNDPKTIESTAKLVYCLMKKFGISIDDVFGHYHISKASFNKSLPSGKYYKDPLDYGSETRTDPGTKVYEKIKKQIQDMK